MECMAERYSLYQVFISMYIRSSMVLTTNAVIGKGQLGLNCYSVSVGATGDLAAVVSGNTIYGIEGSDITTYSWKGVITKRYFLSSFFPAINC